MAAYIQDTLGEYPARPYIPLHMDFESIQAIPDFEIDTTMGEGI
jgi:hypothetical protein